MADSALVNVFMQAYSGNYTPNRTAQGGKIQKITIHHMAGNLTVEQLGNLWQTKGRKGSSHYGVNGSSIGQYVAEKDVAWTDGNWDSNIQSVTIETANNSGAPNWTVSDESLQTLIRLVADIAKRNGLHPLVCGQTLTWHQMYAATECPGPYLLSKMQYITDEANRINSGGGADMATIGVVDITTGGKLQRLYAADANAVGMSENDQRDIRYGVGVRVLLKEVTLANMPAGYSARGGKIQNEDGSISYVALDLGSLEVLQTATEPIIQRFYGGGQGQSAVTEEDYKAALQRATEAESRATEAEQAAAEEKARADKAQAVLNSGKKYIVLEADADE